ncbi:uncharacterized protein LOC131032593 isoform X2 [Cryptomeria japonica]|uniref:uncharacterized protein LOC131032593 isoform X2 n=1 Tax=Cryptomeria japonica TaxID=3369 RepID=UPI0027DA4D39|nr:uncharacterized protein LOC131032593 isoform X2 [Cryptomeria japonica]
MAAAMAMPLSIDRKFVHNNALSSHKAVRHNFFHSNSLQIKLHSQSQGISSRRLLLVTATSSWDALASVFTGQNKAREASLAVKRGMQLFVQGDVEQSLTEFDKAIELDPRQRLYLWQRGLSLYYLNRYEEGAKQFRDDVAANPNDTEESIWCFLCEAQLYGVDEARRRFLEVGPDPRPVMRKAYEMFKNGGNPDELTAEFSNGREHECFYAALYASLYHEAQNGPIAAKEALIIACCSPYGLRAKHQNRKGEEKSI